MRHEPSSITRHKDEIKSMLASLVVTFDRDKIAPDDWGVSSAMDSKELEAALKVCMELEWEVNRLKNRVLTYYVRNKTGNYDFSLTR